ncbi:MAG: hypothetical protein GF400_00855 [Candidatus Eisenbacteria bacterium]|nr:hypothetical protein [Candidatus Eisenbacteria bacterium]
MRNGRVLALLVVLVLSIVVAAPSAVSATRAVEHESSSPPGDVDSWTYKGDDNNASGDDDRWGIPGEDGADEDLPAEGEDDEDSGGDERPWGQGWSAGRVLLDWFLFGSWFVL